MSPRLASLASLMQVTKDQGKKFTLLLGAGASISSNVVRTDKMMAEILEKFGREIEGEDIRDRFDTLWERTPEAVRGAYLKPYLTQKPSSGYGDLAALVAAGYFDVILTFNYDNLMEQAMWSAGEPDCLVIIRGDHTDERVVTMAEDSEQRIKIIKLHGSMRSGNTFLFSRDEMLNYPEAINGLVRRLTRKNILVCGYVFEDICVLRSFSDEGDSIYCVNPHGAPRNLRGFMMRRRSAPNVFDGEEGKFDNFFGALRELLLKPREVPAHPGAKPSFNPFKFLEAYEQDEAGVFIGRRALARKVVSRIQDDDCRILHIVGPAKSGKTSFVRAGVSAQLSPHGFLPVYVRSTRHLEERLAAVLTSRFEKRTIAGTLEQNLNDYAALAPDRRVVLILDQFERFFRRFPDTEAGRRELSGALRVLGSASPPNLTVVTVAIDDTLYLKRLFEQRTSEMVDVPRLEPRRVARIVRILARRAGLALEDRVISSLQERYTLSSPGANAFTLAHIQALCSILCSRPRGTLRAWEEVVSEHLDSLNQAINQCDVLSFLEDCPYDEQRAILCKILRIVSEPGRGQIIEFLRDHFEELIATRRSGAPRRTHAAGN